MDSKVENKIISEYKKGKSSLEIVNIVNLSKPTILKILRKHNLVRKRDRCKSLKITRKDGGYIVERVCPKCKKKILTKSKDKIIACRNHFNKLKENRNCKKCSLSIQIGEGNPFYGKTHTKKTKKKISESRKGKATGDDNSMANPKHKERSTLNLKKKWNLGLMEHARKIMSEKMKETRRLGKIKSVNRSKKEIQIVKEIRNKKLKVVESYRIDTKICDIYIPKFNLIIEYNGDYWHCNPKKYEPNFINKVKNKTAKEIWDYDKSKVDLILEKGYNLEIVWESDLKKNPDIINKIIDKYDNRE
jgi:very-short-patch-repair endonuclease